MAVEMRELYSSPNGDRWYLARDVDVGQVFIRHEPNLPSGGRAAHIEVGAFLRRGGQGPEHRELLRLIGTLVEQDRSLRGTAARIKSHAKSHIVELTEAQNGAFGRATWPRRWRGRLRPKLRLCRSRTNFALMFSNFALMFSSTNPAGPGWVRLTRVTIGPLRKCASP
jgi:hypothetical protein